MSSLNVNSKTVTVASDPETPLLWVLRCELHLTGTKFGCGVGVCGACTVHLNDKAGLACQTKLNALHGEKITTIEGVQGVEAKALRAAWLDIDVAQCGYCQSAQFMAACALLRNLKRPLKPAELDDEIDAALCGIVCRCGTYPRIRKAIQQAAKTLHFL
ncbi:(2Fe-2S)-binding protein [Paraburkholderia sartisoli]|uniref:Isoquinoline 1-oxidoreductase, alpha subunit n=1 Tax=Paraburkholderia sartisoli TaxID=83784 RepID=A0A1H4GL93_9BURK|nr:(2Fe-2S)-binding protein [Paraburkholderia sartisoli]SEB10101.1 isoquinoline 1-oxidoreductase, alpha subunit [Paraburkholderia sartisoli]